MSLLTTLLNRRLFLKWAATVTSSLLSLNQIKRAETTTSQATPKLQGYGSGSYGQNVYAGTPLTENKTFLPLINRGEQ